MFFDGPHLGRGTDRSAFQDSNIRTKFENALLDAQKELASYSLLGDKIFRPAPPCFKSLATDPATVEQQRERVVDVKGRGSVEWTFGLITENWKFITYAHHLKIELSAVSRDILFVPS